MKALRFYAPEDVRLEDVPEPECGPGEIKLRVRNCSTCGTDVKIFHNGHQNLTPPRTIGHEIAGEVVEVGADVNATYGAQFGHEWAVGDRAQVIAAVPCGDCHECNKGWMAVCQNQTSVGYQYDGGFAEYMIVPQQVLKVDGLNLIPDNVGYDEASAAEPFACAINAQELLDIEEGDTLVVFGAGPIGCMHIRIARGVHKVGKVFLVDVNAERLTMSAEAVQPDEVINGAEVDVVEKVMELTGGRGADVIITATAANVTQEQAIAMAARNGRISFFGGLPKTDPTITCDSNVVHYRQLHIHGANGSAPEHNKRALRVHLHRPGAGQGPDHRAPAAGAGARRLRHRQARRRHQGHRRAVARSAHADRAPGRGDGAVLRAARAVEVLRRVQRRGARTGVVGARGHVDRQRAVPDLLRRRRGRCRSTVEPLQVGAVVRDPADGLGARALGQQVEEVVADARGVVHVVLADQRRTSSRTTRRRCWACPSGGSRAWFVEVELLADQVVARVVRRCWRRTPPSCRRCPRSPR